MPADAFVIRYHTDEDEFLQQFLSSPDFDVHALKNICRKHGLNQVGTKVQLVQHILSALQVSTAIHDSIVKNILTRPKPWLQFKVGRISKHPLVETQLSYLQTLEKQNGTVRFPWMTNKMLVGIFDLSL